MNQFPDTYHFNYKTVMFAFRINEEISGKYPSVEKI